MSRLSSKIALGLAFIGMLVLSACTTDACDEIDCGTGDCVDGTCVCDSLREGFNCEILASEKFKGTWLGGDICGTVSTVYDCEVTDGSSEGQLVLSPFGPDRLPVIALVSNNNLILPEQAYGQAVLHGNGGIADSVEKVTLDYKIDYGGGEPSACLTTLELP